MTTIVDLISRRYNAASQTALDYVCHRNETTQKTERVEMLLITDYDHQKDTGFTTRLKVIDAPAKLCNQRVIIGSYHRLCFELELWESCVEPLTSIETP